MGKRSDFPRRPRDNYPTPAAAVQPLHKHLKYGSTFDEPCAGEGQLIQHLEFFGHKCITSSDIKLDARKITSTQASYFITNPPWDRKVMHGIIDNLAKIKPTWLLIDADWMHTLQAVPYMAICKKVVSIGRVKWIPYSKFTSKDNCCWYLFDNTASWFKLFNQETKFYGRET